jgi:transposase InsO family protein
MNALERLAWPLPLQSLLLSLAGWVNRGQQDVIDYPLTEIAIRDELLGGRRPRLTDAQRRRLATKAKPLSSAALAKVASIATPDTILRWFRELVAEKYDGTGARGPGRPRIAGVIAALILRIARENPTYGYTRTRNTLENLGHDVSRSTVARVMTEHGLEPASRRGSSWKDFLAAHWDVMFGADFFTVEVMTRSGIVRYLVLFVMELKTRRVHVAGITRDNPGEEWLKQVARNITDAVDGFLARGGYLILDRDPLFSAAFRRILTDRGVSVLRLPRRSPNLNAYCERWVRSIRRECLLRVVLIGERSLHRAVSEFVKHYHAERNHQGLESRLIEPEPGVGSCEGRVVRRVRLGGLLNYYHRRAS